jgi:hypothetical protein
MSYAETVLFVSRTAPRIIKTVGTAAVLLSSVAVMFSDDFRTIDGKEYNKVSLSRVEPDGIVVITDSGVVKLYFTELPKEVQQKYHFDPVKAAAFANKTAQNQQAIYEAAQAAIVAEGQRRAIKIAPPLPRRRKREQQRLWTSGRGEAG